MYKVKFLIHAFILSISISFLTISCTDMSFFGRVTELDVNSGLDASDEEQAIEQFGDLEINLNFPDLLLAKQFKLTRLNNAKIPDFENIIKESFYSIHIRGNQFEKSDEDIDFGKFEKGFRFNRIPFGTFVVRISGRYKGKDLFSGSQSCEVNEIFTPISITLSQINPFDGSFITDEDGETTTEVQGMAEMSEIGAEPLVNDAFYVGPVNIEDKKEESDDEAKEEILSSDILVDDTPSREIEGEGESIPQVGVKNNDSTSLLANELTLDNKTSSAALSIDFNFAPYFTFVDYQALSVGANEMEIFGEVCDREDNLKSVFLVGRIDSNFPLIKTIDNCFTFEREFEVDATGSGSELWKVRAVDISGSFSDVEFEVSIIDNNYILTPERLLKDSFTAPKITDRGILLAK